MVHAGAKSPSVLYQRPKESALFAQPAERTFPQEMLVFAQDSGCLHHLRSPEIVQVQHALQSAGMVHDRQ